jgi:hypothetical protein
MRPTRKTSGSAQSQSADIHVHIQAAFWPRDPVRAASTQQSFPALPEHRRDNLRLAGVAIQQHAPGK